MNCAGVVVWLKSTKTAEKKNEEEKKKVKTTIKMHKTFCRVEMSRDTEMTQREKEWRVPTDRLTDKQSD